MAPDVDYTKLSLTDVRSGLQDLMRQAQATFGAYDARQLNWRPDATRWSVAQCFEHLLTSGNLIRRSRGRPEWHRAPNDLAAPPDPAAHCRPSAHSFAG